MEPGEKKLNDDMVVFVRKRSETEAPRYTARLKTYLDIQQKRRRAEAARKHSAHVRKDQERKKADCDQNATDNCVHHDDGEQMKRRGGAGAQGRQNGLLSRSRSGSREPVDACGCRRKRKRKRSCSKRRRRRRSCRRRRRRRSCRRKRRRRRSCSRRRRRRSCRRRRRKRRRCR